MNKTTKLLTVVTVAFLLVGCTNRQMGTGVGAASGFLVGSAFGKGRGSLVGAGVGTALGAIAGNAIGGATEN